MNKVAEFIFDNRRFFGCLTTFLVLFCFFICRPTIPTQITFIASLGVLVMVMKAIGAADMATVILKKHPELEIDD